MRLPGLLIALAACSSSSSSVTDGGAGALSCGSTVAAYCGASGCQRTLAGAEQDKSLCPASLTPCGDYNLILKGAIDTATTYYYLQGNLLAVGHTLLPGKITCVAGPSTFTPPSCQGTSQPLPACQ
jgi:hypothetical protein